MTGDRNKTRVIVSQRLISPLSCCNNFNSKAIEFRASVVQSLSSSRLNADVAVKAAMGKKPTYEDTDNKKREFTGTTKPGVEEIAPGMRVETKQAWEEGRSLVLYPNWKSKRSMSTEANFGWIKDKPDTDFETAQKIRDSKPEIQFTKYDVSSKTGDVIPDSETEIDMAYPSLGLSRAQRLKKDNYISNPKMEFKAGLPGRSLESRVPGGNLLARAAGRFGIMRDAANKFRCPPGTPAANQFTDHLGSNCFGVSAERAAKFIADKIGAMMRTEDNGTLSLASGAKSTWAERVRARLGGSLPGRDPSYDGSTGERIPTPDARAIDVPGKMRWFKNATINAQEKLRRSENTVNKLSERLGLPDFSPESKAVNDDRWAAFAKLQSMGLWDVKVTGRLKPDQVESLVLSRLQRIPQWRSLGEKERDALLAADIKRYYETERAFLDTALEQYALRPEHMRTVGEINFRNDSLPEGAEANTQWVPSSKGSDIKSVINVHIPTVMGNQEQLIPNMSPSERLVISAVGAPTDAAATAEIADFLVNTEYTARGMAGLIDGPRSFARHIMLHEIGHTIQGEAFLNAIKRQLDATGKIDVPVIKGGKISSEMREVTDFKKLTGNDLAALIISSQDDINVASLDESLSRLENVAFLAGSYPNVSKSKGMTEVYALEATAELFALREEGIIFGDDIDDALSFMDDAIGERAAEARAISDAEIFERLEESYFSPYDKGEDVLPIRKHLRAPIELDKKAIDAKREKRRLAEFSESIEDLNQEQLATALADVIEYTDMAMSKRNELINNRKLIESSSLSDEEKEIAISNLDSAIAELEELIALNKKAEQIAISKNKSFNTDGKKASDAEIKKMAREILDKRPPATPEEAARRMSAARTDALSAEAGALSDEMLVKKIADYDLMASSMKPDSDEYIQSIADREIFVRQYVANKRSSGDTRPERAIRNELKADITKEITASRDAVDGAKRGKLKPQKMKSKEHIAANAKKERAKHRRNITKQQFEAVKEIDDFNAADITQVLDPNKQVVVGRAINKRNARLKRLGLDSDPSSVDEGSLDEQVENILIPAMEAMDASSITTPFEMEMFIDSSKVARVKPGKEIDLDSFGQGKVLSRSMKAGKPEKGTKKKRVIVRMQEGDRGLFPLAKKGEDQNFVIPPGKLRVVGRDKDGSLILEVSSQKDTVDVLDDLSKSIGDGPDDAIWRKGAKRKIQAVADRYAVRRKDDAAGTKSDDAARITETSESILTEVAESGSEFGETTTRFISDTGMIFERPTKPSPKRDRGRFGDSWEPDPYSYPELYIQETNETPPSLSSGVKESTESLRAKRQERFKSVLGDVNSRPEPLLSSMSALKQENEIVHRRVEEILNTESFEQINERIENAALKLHSGFDRRVRVRMKENDIEEFSKSGKVRAIGLSSGAVGDDGETRRTRRRAVSFRNRKSQESVAQSAKEDFIKLREAGIGGRALDRLDDEKLKTDFGLERSSQQSVLSGNPIYMTDSADRAIALMALGYEVEVPDRGERKMVKNAALQTEQKLKEIAEDDAKKLNLTGAEKDKYIKEFLETHDLDLCALYEKKKNVFCSENIDVNREKMPQSGGPAKSANSPAMRALKYGHVSGEYKSKSGLSEDDSKRYKEISKKLEKPSKFADVSEEDKQWVFDNTDWSRVEVKTEPELIEFLKKVLPAGDDSVVRKSIKADDLYASQKQLRSIQIHSSAENMFIDYVASREGWGEKDSPEYIKNEEEFRKKLKSGKWTSLSTKESKGWGKPGSAEFAKNREEALKKMWFQGPILTSEDGYVVDGHHRWAAIKMLNDHLPENEKIEVQVNQLQTSIFESLTLAKVFQEHMEIKGKTVGKVVPYEDGETTPMSRAEFDEHIKKAQDSVAELAKKIQDDGLYPVSLKDIALKREPRSPGLKENRDRSVKEYGMTWKPEYSKVKSVEESKKWDGWDGVEVTEVDLSSDILPTESHLKGESIDKVVSGGEPLREGYFVNLVIDQDGKMYVSDGHNRVAMNRALGNEKIQARVVDLRRVEAPWGEQSSGKTTYKGYDLVEPANPLPGPDDGYPDEVVEAATAQREKLKTIEKEITSTLIDLSEKHGSVMVGLAARFKSVKSLARKINDERGNRTAEEAAADMSDVIRYTMTFTPENYVSGAKDVIADLNADGYQLLVKNYWKAGDAYQGINIAAVHPDGTRFELQFHTPQSAFEKEAVHKVLDDYRIEKDPKKRWVLYDRMVRISARIDTPVEDGVLDIGEVRSQDFSLALSSGATTRRDKINKRGLIDKFVLEKNKTGDEARGFEFDSSSINKPTKIDKDEFFKIVGEVPGVSDSDELLKTEKLTSSRVQGLEMFRGTYNGKNGEKNRVFGRYTTPDGRKYTISNDKDGFEGMYYAYQGDKRLKESERVGKLTLILNDNKLNFHDLFNIDVNDDDRKSGLAQAMVEVAKADFPDATFTTRRVVTDEGAQFARNIGGSRGAGKTDSNLSLSSGATTRRDVKRGVSQYELPTYEQLSDKQKEKVRKTAARVSTEKRDDAYYEMMKDKFNFPPMEYVPEYDELTPKQKEEVRKTASRVSTEKRDDVYYEMMKDKFNFKPVKRKRKQSELSLSSGAQGNSETGRSTGKNRNKKEVSKKEQKPDWFEQFGMSGTDGGSLRYGENAMLTEQAKMDKRMRSFYEAAGLGPEVRDELMPVSGYLVHKSQIQKKKNEVINSRSGNIGPDAIFEIGDEDIVGDGLTALGDVEVVLKPEISKRTSYGKGDGLKNGHRPVRMDSKSKDDVVHAMSFPSSGDADSESADSIVNLLASSVDGDFSRVSKNSKTKGTDGFEAHILGGFDKDEVDSINYPYSKLSKMSANEDISDVVNDKTIADSLRRMGFTQEEINYFYSVGGSGQMNTESMKKLREYRTAKKVKSKYSELGFNKVNIAHPQGINIENPRSHSKASRGIEDVETLLREEIAAEIMQTAKDLLKKMRKGSKPNVISKIGSGI